MKVVFSGKESSGKTLKLAEIVAKIAYRNHDWFKKSGQHRPIALNFPLSEEFETFCREELQVPIMYWKNIDDLIKLKQCDVFIDEIGNYFDSRMWQELSLDARSWLSQGAKTGVELYGAAQDFAQVDKAFRRLVNHLFLIKKIIGSRRPSPTKPPIRFIWGICLVFELDPDGYDEDKKKFAGSGMMIPSIMFIERKYCEMFDTTYRLLKSNPPPYRHIERECENEKCDFHRVIHA